MRGRFYMKKKLVGIFIFMLMISNALTTILFSHNEIVKANEVVNLDNDYVWNLTNDFANVIHNVNWSENGENGIPKGRSWATAGEDYTIENILEPNMKGENNPCGLTEYSLLPIGYVSGPRGKVLLGKYIDKEYSTKIVIHDYNLTLENQGSVYKYIPYPELFPYGIGLLPNYNKEYRTHFSSVRIRNLDKYPITNPFSDASYYYSISTTVLNNNFPGLLAGTVKYIEDDQSIPENQNDTVFLMNETTSCETKIQNITDKATGCILIHDQNRGYTFENAADQNCSFARIGCTNTNLSLLLNDLGNGSEYFAMIDNETQTLNFFNTSYNPISENAWVGLMNLSNESTGDNGFSNVFLQNRRCYYYNCCHRDNPCKGIIIAGPGDTHFMLPTSHAWMWFNIPYWLDVYWVPMLSVNASVAKWLRDNIDAATVSGFIDQDLYEQTEDHPGVISNNVVAYRNISHSPDDKIVVLSNRIDGWFSEAPGDSGVGGAILLGIAKYFKDNDITPKYNLTFLFTTGEEYGMRGAQHFVDTHPNGTDAGEYNYIHWIGFDQLGFDLIDPLSQSKLQTEIKTTNVTMKNLISTIASQTNYEERTENKYDFNVAIRSGGGAEDFVWKNNCSNTILFDKDRGWDGWHRAGNNYADGDSLSHIDRDDVNVTFELAWNVTKYFTVNPDCWFSNVTFTPFDSPNDGDTLLDSIRTNFTIHSVLPSDRVRVELDLGYNINGEKNVTQNAGGVNYTVTSGIQNCSYIFTIPDTVVDAYYNVSFKLYNSTGYINKIVYNSSSETYYNDTTDISNWIHLYHPLGYTKAGHSHKCVYDNISGSVFTANEYGEAQNITAHINLAYMSPGPYRCMLYQASNGTLIGNTTSDWEPLPTGNPELPSTWWAVFNFTGEKPHLVKGTQYIITCWGDSPYSWVSYDDSGFSGTGRYYNHSYGDPPIQGNFINESRYYSIYCGYTPALPRISDVLASPHTVGYGFNVTISANVTAPNGVNQVKVHIDTPGGGFSAINYTMTHTAGNTYQYVYPFTWFLGCYEYTIWVIDNMGNVNSSAGHHFHVSVNATISIATLQDSYTGNQYINITDPPNLPENYSLVGRDLTWDEYYNAVTGQNMLEVSTGPINYQEDNGTWTPINNTMRQLESNHPAYVYGYRNGNDHGLYGVYFKSNAQSEWPVAFTYNRSDDPAIYAVRSKLVGVGYVDPASNWAYQYLQSVQSSQGQTNDNSITYEDVFTGTDVTWSYGTTGLKEEITLSNATKTVLQNHPPSMYGLNNGSSYLVFITKLDHQNLNLCNSSGVLEGNVTISDTGVDFKDLLGQFTCALPLGEAYEMNNESVRERLTYRIIHLNGNTYLLSGLKVTDLTAMAFPVVIDPTLTIYSTINDGYIYKSSTNYNTAWTASTGTVDDSGTTLTIGQKKATTIPLPTYYIYRGFLFFNTTLLPSNAYIDNATLGLYKSGDSSATDFQITVQNGLPIYPHSPLQTGDYGKIHYSGNGGMLNTSMFVNGCNNITLNNDGKSWLNRTGLTKLCLRSSRDINGNTPTGNEYVTIYANDMGGHYQPKLVITYRNQSKIKNTGSTCFKGYLLIQVQYYDSGVWVLDNTTVDEPFPRTIDINSQLALDRIFNGRIRSSDLKHGVGTYRVYTAFRDPTGTILKTDTSSSGRVGSAELKAWRQFSKT